jgi:hypothetical protein
MADIVISGDSSGSVTLRAPAVSGTTVLTLPTTSGTIVTTAGATSLTTSGNLTFTGTGNRIIGDFSNATLANRVLLQSSTSNGQTAVGLIPNGTSTQSQVIAFNSTDPANSSYIQTLVSNTEARINSGQLGTGTNLPLTMFTGGSERLRIDTSGNVGIGISPTSYAGGSNRTLQIYNSASANAELRISNSTTGTGASVGALIQQAGNDMYVWNASNSFMSFGTNATERMRIDSIGNLLVGATSSLGGNRQITCVGATTSRGALILGATTQATNNVVGSVQAYNGTQAVASIDLQSSAANNSGSIQVFTWSVGTPVAGPFVSSGGNSWTSSSDETLKDIIEPIENSVQKVSSLRAVIGKFKTDPADTRRAFLIAQDVQAVLPEAVNEDRNGKLGLNYQDVIPLLVASIKELNAKVTALEKQLGAK